MFPYKDFSKIQKEIGSITKKKNQSFAFVTGLSSARNQQSLRKKLNNLRKQAKQVNTQFIDAICSKKEAEKSISKLRRDTVKVKRSFVKLYDNKMFRQQNCRKIQDYQEKANLIMKDKKSKTKQKKIISDFQLILRDSQKKQRLSSISAQKTRYKQKLQRSLDLNRNFIRDQEQRSVALVKDGKRSLEQRKQKMKNNRVMSARKNYMERVSNEIIIINRYQQLTDTFSEFCPEDSKELRNLTFLITNNKTDS